MIDIVKEAKNVFEKQIKALSLTADSINESFIEIVEVIRNCNGKIIVTGMGKSGHIARKIAATLSSLGTSAVFLHPGEALHGDLGVVEIRDVVLAISNSGESEEIIKILPNIKLIGAKLIGFTSKLNSSLAESSDYKFIYPTFEEACNLGVAPTSSTTVSLVLGDALAVVLSMLNNFNTSDFGLFHPAGSLGKRLLVKVNDLMLTNNLPIIQSNASFIDAIIVMNTKGLGFLMIVDNKQKLIGVLSDGDIRRMLLKNVNIYSLKISEVMNKPFKSLSNVNMLALDALHLLNINRITSMPILDGDGMVIGLIRTQDIIEEGIFI